MKRTLIALSRIAFDTRVILVAALCAAGFFAILYFAARSSSHFAEKYIAYTQLAKVQVDAAYLPAAPDNPVRQQLNLMLSLVLDKQTPTTKRLSDAQQGLALLNQLNAQIDAIGTAGDKANIAIAQMQIASLKDFGTSGQTRELIDLAKQRSAIIEDIRGLSYRADYATEQIFQRVIDDKGALTDAHIADLNNEIPDVEAQFDHRSSLYSQLELLSSEIDQKAAALKGAYALTAGSGQ